MWRARLLLVAVNLIVFLVLAEALALWLYYDRTGHLFYAHAERAHYELIEETEQGMLTADALHPYFGPIHKPGVRPDTNNIGFGSPHAFPFARTSPQQYLVGIFGGSVARQFCDHGAPRLATALARRADLVGREIVPLCFAHEGYKQPQQLIVLAYFLSIGQAFDLVVNIDGFNEVALGALNHERGRDVSMPSPLHLDPLISLIDRAALTPSVVESLAAVSRYKDRLNATARRLEEARSAFVHFVLARYYDMTRNAYQAEVSRLAATPSRPAASSLVYVTPPVRPRDAKSLYDDIAVAWAEASRLMHDITVARGATYVHVLQPNQYYTARPFSADEARVALNDATPFKQPVITGYPALQKAATAFAGVLTFVDATKIFDAERSPMYQDDCCHYTPAGYERLAAFIAAQLDP